MNILITGCAGFIGNAFALKILKTNKKIKVIGLDNLNDFYSIKLKKKRQSLIKNSKNFKFYKIDLLDKKKLEKLFKENKIDIIFNFAAQAGVRYVSSHPEKFIESNIYGFHNLIEVSKKYKISKFFYASSSSVYGDKNKFPVSENVKLYPKNIYGLSKKMNEEYVNISLNNKTKYIGLRFFTVFGEWGRPDMLILKFLDYARKNKEFLLNNGGNHWRDFTYIEDVVEILSMLKNKKFKKNQIYNICSNRPIHIKKLVNYLIKKTHNKKIKNVKHNSYEAFKTHGQNNKILKTVSFKKFSDFYTTVDATLKWYKEYNHLI
jgi:UDP-glucuronate 4-epimerase